jgi:PhnB protein
MDKRPDRYRNAIVPHIYVEGAAAAVAFYERAEIERRGAALLKQ